MTQTTRRAQREIAQVRRLARRVENARGNEERARAALAAAIVAAHDAGAFAREIGDAAGLTAQRVSQIYHETKGGRS